MIPHLVCLLVVVASYTFRAEILRHRAWHDRSMFHIALGLKFPMHDVDDETPLQPAAERLEWRSRRQTG